MKFEKFVHIVPDLHCISLVLSGYSLDGPRFGIVEAYWFDKSAMVRVSALASCVGLDTGEEA